MRPSHLPDALRERTRALSEGEVEGEYILVWMRAALRAWENPCLDVALAVGEALALPVFVYRGLDERYPYASDRHHTFILEGHRDVGHALTRRGLGTALHVARPGHRGPHLKTLAAGAALVLTEDVPLHPLATWARRLAGAVSTPIWLVDTACVVPMAHVGCPFDRAFAFRSAIEAGLEARVHLPWSDHPAPGEPFVPDLPFAPVDLEQAPIDDLVSECAIDHTVGPVPHTRGGSEAGYARWRRWVEGGGLRRYAGARNNPLTDGVSRMSAYLHHGMVAPTRLAREAAKHGGRGAEKYLDELVVWRELAWSFCRHRDPTTLAAVPAWARETLERHTGDPRPLPDRDTLARGRTGDALWDAAQRSLLRHGELHNNVRMTWGKALVGWTPGPEAALETLRDLNHRYALDGRDPASYGGLLWCLGAFDRPFPPERPVWGTVRPRSTDSHAARLNVDAYARHTSRPLRPVPPRTLVVGGGVAGALCARVLHDHGYPVTVLDKARGAGGRLSTRRAGALRFDHGSPVLGNLPAPLARYLDAWVEAGVLAPWSGPFARYRDGRLTPLAPGPRWIGEPGMNTLVKHLLADVDVRFGHRVERLTREEDTVVVETPEGSFEADHVVLATPAPQAVPLVAALAPALADALARVDVDPAWVLMLGWDHPLPRPWGLLHLEDHPCLRLVLRNEARPGRPDAAQWVVHATPEWSRKHLERAPEIVADALAGAARQTLDLPRPTHQVAHRWRYAHVQRPVGRPFLRQANVWACGDALLGGGVAGALASGAAVAGRLLGHFGATSPEPEPPAQLSLLEAP